MTGRLTRGRLAATGVAALTLAAVAAVVVVARGWWRGDGGSYAPRHVLVRTSVSPRRSLFGQVVTASVRVVVDPRRVDPASVSVAGEFRPFSVRSQEERRGRTGRASVLTFRYALQCVSAACVPRGGSGRSRAAASTFSLRPARLSVRTRAGRSVTSAVRWPVFGVQSRLTAQDLAYGWPLPESPFSAPAVTWRVRPVVVGGVAVGLALLCLLGAGALVASVALADRRPLRVLRIPRNMTPIDRALALAEHAARRGETDESRKALERLAVELRRHSAPAQAVAAERLAWSAGAPTPETVAALAEAVRSNGAH
jgi:hypothetical protein